MDMSRQWWLRNMQTLGGASEIAFLCDCEEVPHLLQIHRSHPVMSYRFGIVT
ncbi:unnamed protein product [Mycetohabitans rhizoxinica HKI 454]|uniref:Uncharacterized protein n=1 Tax=Mycetohabitans rhizoxinica (strain DSM 19002 / CIP 109453 / HKI 454) TaxID=882378 RepID=E5ASK6_MYCRK|nr:unnamed protein product [Mycetohabitans rhizoxinica HKI 454]